MGMVKEIEELGAKLQIHSFSRQGKVLDYREIRVHETRTIDRRPGHRAQLSRGRGCESARIEPIGESVNLSRTIRTASFGACLVRIAHLIRPLQNQSVVEEEDAGLIRAIDHEERKPRLGPFDDIDLPISQHCVNRSTPVAAEMPSLTERQIIENAGGKDIVQVELRQSPIQLLRTRERPIECARIAAQTVRKTGIESAGPSVANQRVQAVPSTFGLGFHLERIVTRRSYAVIAVNRLERKCVRERRKATAPRVAGDYAACSGRTDIFVYLAN